MWSSGSRGDNYEIVNPYTDDMVSNTNAFIGQYCAAKGEDWEDISLADLEQTLRTEVSDLYTFSRTSETRTVPDDPETAADESGTETWYIYTIVYQGEAHFADEIFHLTDEQKELAEDYAQNLSLFLGDGMFQSSSGTVIPSLGSVRFTDGAVEVDRQHRRLWLRPHLHVHCGVLPDRRHRGPHRDGRVVL